MKGKHERMVSGKEPDWSYCTHNLEAESEHKMEAGYTAGKPTSSDTHPPPGLTALTFHTHYKQQQQLRAAYSNTYLYENVHTYYTYKHTTHIHQTRATHIHITHEHTPHTYITHIHIYHTHAHTSI